MTSDREARAARPIIFADRLFGAVDRGLERLHERLGWKIILAYQLASWGAALALGIAMIPFFARMYGLEMLGRETITMIGLTLIVWAIGTTLGTAALVRLARPIIEWYRGGCAARGASIVWPVALRLPYTNIAWNLLVALLVVPAGVSLAVARSTDLGGEAHVAAAVACVLSIAVGTAGGVFTAQIALRPLVRRISSLLTSRPRPPRGVTVRLKLLVAVPVGILIAGVLSTFVMIEPGGGVGSRWGDIAIAAALLIGLAVPVGVLLGFSTLQPLEDLLAATERVKRGDYTTPVPELTADEHGALARSFNEAMDGLAERQRLAEENVALLDEVRASRARIVAASDEERKRVERNIHDGAQQRLVALALRLRLLEEHPGMTRSLAVELDASACELAEAIDDLRELARGLHPSVLSTDGLRPALEQLADTATLPVTLDVSRERYSESIESTSYFVASEALANIAKHARASAATITIAQRDGKFLLEITDDGIGGASVGAGSGLTGLADRVEAVGGSLSVESPPTGGTTVRAELPIGTG